MLYLHEPTGEYPLTRAQVTARIPQRSFGPHRTDFSEWGFQAVRPHPQPFADPGQRVVEAAPIQDGGVWRQTWAIETIPAAERAEQRRADAQARLDAASGTLCDLVEELLDLLIAKQVLGANDLTDGLRAALAEKRAAREQLRRA